jgi:serine phosphatase RsbU (regulator of sigma subunit)
MATEPGSNGDEIRRLRRAVEELSVLNELARAISVSRDPAEINRTIVDRSRKAVKAEQANITLVDKERGISKGTLTFVRDDGAEEHFHLNQNLLGMMFNEKRAQLINDVHRDPRLSGVEVDTEIRNLISVPLMVGADLIGVLSAYNKREGRDFSPEDQRILAIIGSQSAQVLEHARLSAIDIDMKLAEHIQGGLLPQGGPEIPGYDIHGHTTPAGHLGGDYFDFIPLEDRRWGLALGDVSGKGVPASLLMSNLQATLRSQAHFVGSCHQCVRNVNRMLYLSTTPDKFATLFYAVLDTRSNVLTYCTAGHEQPFLVEAGGSVRRLDRGGLAVGIIDDFDFEDDVLIMQPGDLVVVFSDGVTDMENPAEENFGERRLMDLVLAHRHLGAGDLVDLIRGQVAKHAESADPLDDVTVMVIKRSS